MGNLMASLLSAAGSLQVFDRALSVVQNNVTNASVPGYAKQRLTLEPRMFQPALGYPGGVEAGDLQSYRDEFAEQLLRKHLHNYGYYSQKGESLAQVESAFDITAGAGVAGALEGFFQAFSSLSVAPNSIAARQVVLDRSRQLALSFNQNASALQAASAANRREITVAVNRINALAAQLRDINAQLRQSAPLTQDAGLDARLHATLEELAEMIDFTALPQDDGTVMVLFGGQTPLVIGDRNYPLAADFSGGDAKLLLGGQDVTSQIERGRLRALVEIENVHLPSCLAQLNQMAATLADRVNTVLQGGVDLNGAAPVVDLFTYDPARGAAASLAVSSITTDQIAAASASAPGGNGNALLMTALAASKEIQGQTFAEFYGALAGSVGREVAAAQRDELTFDQLLAQARALRDQASAVSLDEEAVHMIEFQRAYQATARLLSVLNDLTGEALNILR